MKGICVASKARDEVQTTVLLMNFARREVFTEMKIEVIVFWVVRIFVTRRRRGRGSLVIKEAKHLCQQCR
jgi:hypothetical protein